jgi:hypothetical protein
VAATLENGNLKFSAARCVAEDNFCRKKGRQLAIERLENGAVIKTVNTVEKPENVSITHWFRTLAEELAYRVIKGQQKVAEVPV